MSDPNEVVLVIRREKAQQLYDELQGAGDSMEYVSVPTIAELEAKLAEALRES